LNETPDAVSKVSPPAKDASTDDPEIAVVTITKDDPVGIKKTIASVERQDLSQYEHIVVDGGSDPEVAEWLRGWRDADPRRRRLVTDPPKGIYPSMNAGLQSTVAPIIVILNGADQLTDGALLRVRDHHRAWGWRWAYGGVEGRAPDGHLLGQHAASPLSRVAFRAGLEFIPHPAAYVTRDLYDEVGVYREDLGSAADQEFFLRACLVAEPSLIPGIVAVFEMGGTSSQVGRIEREISWHHLRTASKTSFGGSPVVDLFATGLLIGWRFVKDAWDRARRVEPRQGQGEQPRQGQGGPV
jgi:glycosyltransferase involved in cell wall biosynthesis